MRSVIFCWLRNERGNLVPRACDPREGTRGSGIISCRKPGILAKIELRIPFQRPIRFLPETDYPRASRSFPRIAGSGNEIAKEAENVFLTHCWGTGSRVGSRSSESLFCLPRASLTCVPPTHPIGR